MDNLLNNKGITLMYDAIFACIIMFFALAIFANSIPRPILIQKDLSEYANSVLIWMDSKGLLTKCIYEEDLKLLSSILNKLCPKNYRLEVYSLEGTLLWSYTSSGFDFDRSSASQQYLLISYQGIPSPRFVILKISP
ncbi:MAG: hypothetical protein NZ922_02495 [Candidatus Methanomethyliaceae archaeon]|nr:hypothetical protein [Candidatus Methanomethyliaceae archaeon]MDW7971557.1 hypothetical protein [Nitrososphaerota archaeon]